MPDDTNLEQMTAERDEERRRVDQLQRAYDGAEKKSDEHRVICDSLKEEIADLRANIIEERRELREVIAEANVAHEKIGRRNRGLHSENESLRDLRDRLITRAKFAEDNSVKLPKIVKAAQKVVDTYQITSKYNMENATQEIERSIWSLKNTMIKTDVLRKDKQVGNNERQS